MGSGRPVGSSAFEIGEFLAWLASVRGLRPASVRTYGYVARRVTESLGCDPAAYEVGAVRRFVRTEAVRGGDSHARNTVTATRSLLRFLAATGRAPADLALAVPGVACWRLASIPRFLPWPQVERVIASCDRRKPDGARNRAILLLLARLALRASDVAAMRLDALDFDSGCIRVAGKGRRDTLLPLPQEVGDALLEYLDVRPSTATREVFVSSRCGARLSSAAISGVVRAAIKRSGVAAPSTGAHLFRHSAATEMLRLGASLEAISALLRHASLDTTAIYTKVDLVALNRIAQPWPEVSSC